MTGQVLTSWKEIAAYLGKGVRTVQRWEAEMGLPVRRPGPERHIVIAFPAELDEWLRRGGSVTELQFKKNGDTHSELAVTLEKHISATEQLARLRHLMAEMLDRLTENRRRAVTLAASCGKHLKKGEEYKMEQSA